MMMMLLAHSQSVLEPAGSHAGRIAAWTLVLVGLLGAIFLVVMLVALGALLRRHQGIEQEPVEETHGATEATTRKLQRVVGTATVVTAVILIGLVITSVAIGRLTSRPSKSGGMVVEVTGNQWWWSVRYVNDDPRRVLVTANEIHIPVARPVLVRGLSSDVIHSFWAPSLQGKRDLIPGRVTSEWIEADRPGAYRAQCAEFCGLQHAHMALWVVAEPEKQFEAWMQKQLAPAAEADTVERRRGREVFLRSACVLCHAIGGTTAAAQNGPDLTHFGSRRSIAAGTLANNRGNLAGWIADPRTIKPGNHMATVPIAGADLQALVEYLESLQ